MYDELLKRLDSFLVADNSTGSGCSPRHPIGKEAAAAIRDLQAKLDAANQAGTFQQGNECVAFASSVLDPDGNPRRIWIASTVHHDIMAQGDTFEQAKTRLETAIGLDDAGRKTGPSPVVKTFTLRNLKQEQKP